MKLTCDLCGHIGSDVRAGLVAWRNLEQPYAHVDRCTDTEACRSRVEASGETWPLLEEARRTA